jgi:hypothetical protein
MNTNSEVKTENTNSELKPVGDPQGIPVVRGPWHTVCPVCRANWLDGGAWLQAGGPPCKHLTIWNRFRADGTCLQWMEVTWFPGLKAAGQAIGRFLLFPLYAVYMTWQARRARRRLGVKR